MTKDSKQNSQNIQSEIQRAILGADMKLLKSVMMLRMMAEKSF